MDSDNGTAAARAGWPVWAVHSLQSVNLVVFCVQMALSGLSCALVLGTSMLHPNLKTVLCAQSAGFALYAGARTANILAMMAFGIDHLFDWWTLQFLLAFVLLYIAFPCYILIVERAVSILAAKRYANWRKPHLSFALLLATCIYSAYDAKESADAVTQQNGLRSVPNTNFGTILFAYSMIGLAFVEIVVFWALNAHNSNAYKSQGATSKQSLDERYQLAENMRTARLLSPVLVLHFGNVLSALTTPFVMYFELVGDVDHFIVYYAAVSLNTSAINGLIEYTLISRHPILRKRAAKMVRNLKRSLPCAAAANKVGASTPNLSAQHAIEAVGGGRIQLGRNETARHLEIIQRGWR